MKVDEELPDDIDQQPLEAADGDEGKGEPEKKAEVVDLAEYKRVKSELASSRRLAQEHEESAQFWAEKAKRGGDKGGKDDDGDDPVPDEEEIDLVTEISANGTKGLEKVLNKLGYAKVKDVERSITATRSEITEQAELLRAFPDLGDPTTPFFKATAKIYNSLKAEDEYMARSPKLIATAARLAKAEMARPGQRKPDRDYDDDDAPDRDERADRVARQAGDRGRRSSQSDEPETLSASQRQIVRAFQAVGGDINEERYTKRATAGVRIGGLPSARRGAAERDRGERRAA